MNRFLTVRDMVASLASSAPVGGSNRLGAASDAVHVFVTVRDSRRRLATTLTQNYFEVREKESRHGHVTATHGPIVLYAQRNRRIHVSRPAGGNVRREQGDVSEHWP
jgi:hypothetical protein